MIKSMGRVLEITNLQPRDSGIYHVTNDPTNPAAGVEIQLTVLGPSIL